MHHIPRDERAVEGNERDGMHDISFSFPFLVLAVSERKRNSQDMRKEKEEGIGMLGELFPSLSLGQSTALHPNPFLRSPLFASPLASSFQRLQMISSSFIHTHPLFFSS